MPRVASCLVNFELNGNEIPIVDKNILDVNSLAIQRGLTILEDRYRELKEIGKKRFEAWEKEKRDMRQQVAELKQQLEAKEGELQEVVRERDARAKEKAEALKRLAKLMQQLEYSQSGSKEARKEAELTLIHLEQIQEELEQAFLADQSKKTNQKF